MVYQQCSARQAIPPFYCPNFYNIDRNPLKTWDRSVHFQYMFLPSRLLSAGQLISSISSEFLEFPVSRPPTPGGRPAHFPDFFRIPGIHQFSATQWSASSFPRFPAIPGIHHFPTPRWSASSLPRFRQNSWNSPVLNPPVVGELTYPIS